MRLNELHPGAGSKRSKKRVGRGAGSLFLADTGAASAGLGVLGSSCRSAMPHRLEAMK